MFEDYLLVTERGFPMIGNMIEMVLRIPRELDRRVALATIEQARRAVLANERRRHPSSNSFDLRMRELMAAGGPSTW